MFYNFMSSLKALKAYHFFVHAKISEVSIGESIFAFNLNLIDRSVLASSRVAYAVNVSKSTFLAILDCS